MNYVHEIDDTFITEYFGVEEAIDTCHQAFCLYGAGHVTNPPRIQSNTTTESGDHLRLKMSAEWPTLYSVQKTIDEYSDFASGQLGPRTATIQLTDLATGEVAVFDADHITNMRTGAAGALAIKYLAAAPVKGISIIGTGRVARALAACADALIKPEVISATSRDPANRNNFKNELKSRINASLVVTNSVDSCVAEADAILCAVPVSTPILNPNALTNRPLTIVAIAGDPRTRQLAPEILENSNVIVDNLEQARQSGEFLYADDVGRFGKIKLQRKTAECPYTIGDAACSNTPGDNSSSNIAYLTGLAVQDMCAAILIYEKYKNTL